MGGRGGGGPDHNDMIHMCEIPPPPKKKKKKKEEGRMKRRKHRVVWSGIQAGWL